MPYISEERRRGLKPVTAAFNTGIQIPGELNYLITMLAKAYMKQHGESYQTHNDIVGALEGAKLEWYRRRVAPYEDVKKTENGDV